MMEAIGIPSYLSGMASSTLQAMQLRGSVPLAISPDSDGNWIAQDEAEDGNWL